MKRARIKQCPTCLGEAVVYEGHGIDELRGGSYQRWMPCPSRECDDGWVDDPDTASVRPFLYAVAVVVIVVMALMAGLHQSAPRSSPDPTASQPGASGAIAAPGAILPARATVGASGRSSSGAPSVAVGAPFPAGGRAGGSLAVGKASWCAPTPKYCHGWGGRSLLAAVPGYDHVPYWAKVCRLDDPGRCVTVHVVSVCACGTGKVIDLTVYAFRDRLGGRLHEDGTLDVTVRGLSGPSLALPATDTVEEGDTTR